jgi:RHS repeat-associated protein
LNDGTQTTYLRNNLNQYTSVDGTNYSYDINGNLTDDGLFKYYYDCENPLTDVNDQSDTAVASYSYDYLGRRILKTVYGSPDVTTKYCYDGDQVIAEYDGSDNLLRKYVYGPGIDEPICMIDVTDSNAVYYYHFDGLGNIAALSDENADIVESYSYDVFGAPTIYDENKTEISQSAIDNPYMFTARRADDETALYYYRARYYAFDIGRFLQTDPIGFYDGLNRYTYCGNNPLNWTDPLGNITVSVGGGGLFEFALSGQIQEGYVIDTSWNVGYYETTGVGSGTANVAAFGVVGITSADKISDLSGFGGQAGGSVLVLGGEAVFAPLWPTKGKFYYGGEISAGVSLIPVEVHSQPNYTKVTPYFNVKDIWNNPKVVAKGLFKFVSHQIKKRTYADEIVDAISLLRYLYKQKKSEEKGDFSKEKESETKKGS